MAVSAVLADEPIAITKQSHEQSADGKYSFSYETENGISVQEEGTPLDNNNFLVQGGATWYAPDNTVVQLSYTADANGYQAVGTHVPTPPPIPDYILRALEYIRTHPPKQSQL